MRKKRYKTLSELYGDLPAEKQNILNVLRQLFEEVGSKEVLQWNIFVWKFANKEWCYFNHYPDEPVLGLSHGAYLAKQNPLLHAFFDETKKSVGKVIIPDIESISKKGIDEMIKYVAGLDAFH
jgi:hypothetical protein